MIGDNNADLKEAKKSQFTQADRGWNRERSLIKEYKR